MQSAASCGNHWGEAALPSLEYPDLPSFDFKFSILDIHPQKSYIHKNFLAVRGAETTLTESTASHFLTKSMLF